MTITLKEIYGEFLGLELVSNQADFSEFLGKKTVLVFKHGCT